ncbi:aminotransferase class I/II-fold pyridoxal phosphate-dependent enzyme [Zhaonella formicivorans]|uniref:aminotransferase class I/II-fold pyridoxal phosphate-dependent enzyme n=1 Tax=Zhaonella formicivorans TaxID=2528593 RepID=UPI0010CF32E2|nr:aminotransferase class I/II-fold pyridoxal phosphate-dependent enzyme [Zhaonella formicivorans]
MKHRQERTPVFDAVKKYFADGTVPFHVPGHKLGKGIPEFRDYVGENVLGIDLTCFPDTDNICNPRGVIAEAEALAAEAYGADHAFFLVNGTTSGIQAMIMSVCEPGDKIIIPRNAHKSAIGGLIMSGARPVYIEPEMNEDFGISMGVTPEKIAWTLHHHPDARAVFIINPNYYGTASDLAEIVAIAHSFGVPVIVDEAHGAHLKFHRELPVSAMEAGADLAASSTHKLVGSLTQSSILLLKEGLVNPKRVKAVLNLTQTTSPSYILLSSLDVARKQIATKGEELISRTIQLAKWVREELRAVQGLRLFGENLVGHPGCFAFDITKVTINVQGLGMSGYEMENILRSEFKLQVELSDLYNVIFLITLGDTWESVHYLVDCVKQIAGRRTLRNVVKFCPPVPEIPQVSVSPREAFYSSTKVIDLQDAAGEISAEAIMAYPPGIPLICPGEIITQEIIDYVNILKQEHADLQGTEDPQISRIKVLKPAVAKRIVEEDIVGEVG